MFSVHVSSPSSSESPFAFLSHLEPFEGYLSVFCIGWSALHSYKRDAVGFVLFLLFCLFVFFLKWKSLLLFKRTPDGNLANELDFCTWYKLPYFGLGFFSVCCVHLQVWYSMNKCPKSFGLLWWFWSSFPTYDPSDTNSLGCFYISKFFQLSYAKP